MELIRNIFFNTDKLMENMNVKVSYLGELFQNDSEEVTMHMAFAEDWSEAQDIEMEKTELGFQAEIPTLKGDILKFCFKNEKLIFTRRIFQ